MTMTPFYTITFIFGILFNLQIVSSRCMLLTLEEYYEQADTVLKIKVGKPIKQKDDSYNKYKAKWIKSYKGCPPTEKNIIIASTTSSVGLSINVGDTFYYFAEMVEEGDSVEYHSTLCDGTTTKMTRKEKKQLKQIYCDSYCTSDNTFTEECSANPKPKCQKCKS